jgi:mycofactocin precursor
LNSYPSIQSNKGEVLSAMKDNDKDVKNDQQGCQNDHKEDNLKENIFSAEEVMIEEMAIDGICGVY